MDPMTTVPIFHLFNSLETHNTDFDDSNTALLLSLAVLSEMETFERPNYAQAIARGHHDHRNLKWRDIIGSYKKFNLHSICESHSRDLFRFTTSQIFTLCELLDMPRVIRTRNRLRFDCDEALAITLRRFAYPCRWSDLALLFHRPPSEMSEIHRYVGIHIYDNFHHLLDFNVGSFRHKLDLFSDAIHGKGAPLRNCVGFIDGTLRKIARPTINQKICFSGHKRVHGLKFQGVKTPDGIIRQLYGPIEGRRHDAFILRDSGLLHIIENELRVGDRQFCLYGDPAYPLSGALQVPFKGQLTAFQVHYNKLMSKVRQSVEWAFKDIATAWAFMDYEKNQKLLLSPVGMWYKVCGLLTNCLTCMNQHNETSMYFNLNPPAVQDYLMGRG